MDKSATQRLEKLVPFRCHLVSGMLAQGDARMSQDTVPDR